MTAGRYISGFDCPECGYQDETMFVAQPGESWVCPQCGYSEDLAEYLGMHGEGEED